MTDNNDPSFIRVGSVMIHTRMIAYAWLEDDQMVIMLSCLDRQGKPKTVTVPNAVSQPVLDWMMARTVVHVEPPED